jgi:protein ImuA
MIINHKSGHTPSVSLLSGLPLPRYDMRIRQTLRRQVCSDEATRHCDDLRKVLTADAIWYFMEQKRNICAVPHRIPPIHLCSLPPASSRSAPADCDPQPLLLDGFHELLGDAPGDETAALAFTLSLSMRASAQTGKGVCFCRLGSEVQEHGQLYGHGLTGLGFAPEQLLMVTASGEKDLLWALEEAVAGGFGAVVGAYSTGERLYGFATSRRLKLRAAKTKTPLFLIRHYSSRGATAAHGRWRVRALPGQSETEELRVGTNLLGPSRLHLALERMNGLPPQHWEMEFDVARGFHLVTPLENGSAGKASGCRQTG